MGLFKTSMMGLLNAGLFSIGFATLAMLIEPIRNMISSDINYFSMLTMALVIDVVVGAMKYIKLHKFSFRELLLGLIVKVVVAFGGIIIFMAFTMLEDGWASEWFTLVAKFTVLLYPAGSAISSMYVLTDGKFPPVTFMKRLKTFEEVITPTIRTRETEETN